LELQETIRGRRSVRKYKDIPVPRQLLEEIMETACWAPSADNRQPWYFVVLTKPEDIQRLRATMEQVAEDIRPHLEEMFPRHPSIVRETALFLRSLGNAPVYVLAFLQKEFEVRDSMVESVAAAIQNLLLAAHEKGLGACWVNAATGTGYGPAIREMFAPDKGEFLSLVALGYPEIVPKAPPRKPGRYTIL